MNHPWQRSTGAGLAGQQPAPAPPLSLGGAEDAPGLPLNPKSSLHPPGPPAPQAPLTREGAGAAPAGRARAALRRAGRDRGWAGGGADVTPRRAPSAQQPPPSAGAGRRETRGLRPARCGSVRGGGGFETRLRANSGSRSVKSFFPVRAKVTRDGSLRRKYEVEHFPYEDRLRELAAAPFEINIAKPPEPPLRRIPNRTVFPRIRPKSADPPPPGNLAGRQLGGRDPTSPVSSLHTARRRPVHVEPERKQGLLPEGCGGARPGEQRQEEPAHAAHEKDAMPASVKEVQVKQFKNLKQQIRELQMRHKSLEIELCRREWSHSACLREKDVLIRKYKQQLSLAAERERILEQSKMQAELDWQQLCENAESNQYQKSENLTQDLSSAREQAEADLQKTAYGLHEIKTVLSALPVEREQTTRASFNQSVLPEGEKQVCKHADRSYLSKDISTVEIKKLQEQNANLRAAIAQMRKEMESLNDQMEPSLSLTENRQLAEQGSLCTNKIPAGTILSNIKVSSNNSDSVAKPGTEKGPNPTVLEEKMVDVGLQCGVGCTVQEMQNKLKGAARKISVLSQEKQQLIEMGNRLRAELRVVLKEGLWHPVSTKRCTVCFASGTLFPRELVKRIHCQLSALKHLQHRIATQELQYAKQQRPPRTNSLITCPDLKEEEAPSSCGEETKLPSTEVKLEFALENHGPKPRKADTSSKVVQSQPLRQSPRQAQQVQLSSSGASNFCQGVWQALEMESSPSVLSPQKNTDEVEFEVVCSTEQAEESQQNIKTKDKLEMPDLTVRGTRLEVQQKSKSRNLSCAHPRKPKISSKRTKIRNYNIKD
ncbi:coiled-coil domain-containing protein 57 [Phaenicophaeus curvirostris]|uniref:coiled-coil domain-containing protein 57 n=1 Tax=Phaenicophaeus curvirostris TaxID=33595 RepID=UPI0037F0E7EC